MNKLTISCVLLVAIVSDLSASSELFHTKSKITFYPDRTSDYFGFSLDLTNSSLLLGAPKALSRVNASTATGLIFNCSLSSLDATNKTCYPIELERSSAPKRRTIPKNFFRNDMWFGATVASISKDKFFACAPRWSDQYVTSKMMHWLPYGACYLESRIKSAVLKPLQVTRYLAFVNDGTRKEFGEKGSHVNFYAYGQAGMSVKVADHDRIIVGAPGLMTGAGGIIDYRISKDPNSIFFHSLPINNAYFTRDLVPDDYFGYSIDYGVFEINGSILYVGGAPRAKFGYGQVLIFTPPTTIDNPLDIKVKLIGPQLGSYFGASLCSTDLNGDGRSDVLVGAPNYVKKDGGLPFDQGAVFVYLSDSKNSTLILKEAGYVLGSGASGARFGTAVADAGDIDGDGFTDIAIGAPYENEGIGTVYIYRGSKNGLKPKYVQRIINEGARTFGYAISKGVDVDGNHCNDLAIGAYGSATAHIYRCIPTMEVHASIKVPDAMNLPQNATNFTALFCLSVPPKALWAHVKMDLKAKITIDPEGNRAMVSGDSEYTVTVRPGNDNCDEQIVEVKPTADLTKPISMKFELEVLRRDDPSTFPYNLARLSEESTMDSSFIIQLVRDCGEDLICTPWLSMTLVALKTEYVPGTDDKLGAVITVTNTEEPAYGAKVYVKLPLIPIRVPAACSFEGLNMTCNVPAPLNRGESVKWEIELEYSQNTTDDKFLTIEAKLEDALYRTNVTDDEVKRTAILIVPQAKFGIIGKVLPNATIAVTRDRFNKGVKVSFIHSFEIINFGPSNWPNLKVVIEIAENVALSSPVEGCTEYEYNINCTLSVPAKASVLLVLPLRYDLLTYGQYLEEMHSYNATTIITLTLKEFKKMATVSTVLVLDPAPPIWPLVVGCILGFVVLAAIVLGLYKYGFFSRSHRERMKQLQDETSSIADEGISPSPMLTLSDNPNESTADLIQDSD